MRNKSWSGWPQCLLAVAGIILLSSGIVQAAVPWVPVAGSNAAFGYSGGQNDTGVFGNPTVTTLGFAFLNTVNFRAVPGIPASDVATVVVNVQTPNPDGPAIHMITVEEWGTWSNGVSVPADFGWTVANFSIFRYSPTPTGTTGNVPLPAFDLRSDGTWYSRRQLIAGAVGNPPKADKDWINFQIKVTNILDVRAEAAPGSFIEKNGMRIILPEPASALFVLSGLVPLVLRGRRH